MNGTIPKTADGEIIYPGMPLFVCCPFSTQKLYPVTVFGILEDGEVIVKENRHFNGEYWEDGNTEHISKLYASENTCRLAAILKEEV